MRILLDTCDFLWFITGDAALPPGGVCDSEPGPVGVAVSAEGGRRKTEGSRLKAGLPPLIDYPDQRSPSSPSASRTATASG